MKPRSLLLALGFGLLASCSKKEPDNNSKISQFANYNFHNTLEVPITIRVTDTLTGESFYLNVAGLSKVQVPNDKLERKDGSLAAFSYYWATRDGKRSSWYMMQYKELKKSTAFSYMAGQLSYVIDIKTVEPRKDLLYCMGGSAGDMETSSQWETVDAFDSAGKSVWATLPGNMKSHDIVLSSDMTASHAHANNIGATTIDYFDYTLDSKPEEFHLVNITYTTLEKPQELGYLHMFNDAKRPDGKLVLYGTDSLYLSLDRSYPYYLLKKKKLMND